MLKNYLKIAYRNLLRHKVYTFINLTGLAVGMACCLLIALYVQDELSYDRYHDNADRIYRVLHASRRLVNSETLPPPNPQDFQVWGNAPVGPALAADFPEIEKIVRFMSPSSFLMQYEDKRFQENEVVFIDSTAFDVFGWKLLAGNPKQALVAPSSLVLTKRVAEKYFGDANPIGQTLKVNNKFTLTVTGVMENVPANSHFTFDILVSTSLYKEFAPEIFDMWGYVDFYTYFLLAEGADISSLQAKAPDFLNRHYKPNGEVYSIAFEPLTNAYLYSEASRQPGATGSLTNLYIFSSIAIFILIPN